MEPPFVLPPRKTSSPTGRGWSFLPGRIPSRAIRYCGGRDAGFAS